MGFELATELDADGVNAAYFDTRSLNGGFTEIHGDPPHIMGLFNVWRRYHQQRRQHEPATIEIDDTAYYQRVPMLGPRRVP